MKQGLFVLVVSLLYLGFPAYAAAEVGVGTLDLTEATCCGTLSLRDSHGVRRDLNEFEGKVVVVTFGFTRCPDVCPTALTELAHAVESVHGKGKEVQVLFITLDPERDTGNILSQYVPAFHPSFIALRGSEQETVKAARDFRVLYRKVPGQEAKSYTIDHTAGAYLFDRTGKARAYVQSVESKNLLPEIERLLAMRSY